MVFGLGRNRAWIREAKRTIAQMEHDASEHPSVTLSADERVSRAADHLSSAARITRQIAHARNSLAAGGTARNEAIATYGDEAQLDRVESELREALARVRETANRVYEASTERLAKRMSELARELTNKTHAPMPPGVIDSISILEQLRRERDQATEAVLIERMRTNLERITETIGSLAPAPPSDAAGDESESWMQAEVDRQAHEDVKAQVRILTEIKSIIETFLEKRAQ